MLLKDKNIKSLKRFAIIIPLTTIVGIIIIPLFFFLYSYNSRGRNCMIIYVNNIIYNKVNHAFVYEFKKNNIYFSNSYHIDTDFFYINDSAVIGDGDYCDFHTIKSYLNPIWSYQCIYYYEIFKILNLKL